jgi:hypothetical protein
MGGARRIRVVGIPWRTGAQRLGGGFAKRHVTSPELVGFYGSDAAERVIAAAALLHETRQKSFSYLGLT